jgi:hypothetical protein
MVNKESLNTLHKFIVPFSLHSASVCFWFGAWKGEGFRHQKCSQERQLVFLREAFICN